MLRRSVVLIAFCALVAGCGDDESSKYTARQVQESLRAEGLESTMLIGSFGRQGGTVSELLKVFSGGSAELGEGVEEVLYESRFDRRTGPTFQVRIFESEAAAEEWDGPRFASTLIRKGNIVANVESEREAAVRRALDALPDGTETFAAHEVADALADHGFAVSERLSPAAPDLKEAFPQVAPPGVRDVVIARKQIAHSTPAGSVPELLLAALIFDNQGEASCGESNAVGTCLRTWNVVVVVRTSWADAARAALDDLD